MSGSQNLPEKAVDATVIVHEPTVPATNPKKSVAVEICAALAPLALEVVYGLTRKWLAGTTRAARTGDMNSRDRVDTGRVSRSTGTVVRCRRNRGRNT